MNKYGIPDNEIEKLLNTGCPCGKEAGGSNFFAPMGDYSFYCNNCRPALQEQFFKDMYDTSYEEAARLHRNRQGVNHE